MTNSIVPKELLSLIRARDTATIESIVQAHSRTLLRAAYGLGFDQERAGELVQRVWCTFVEVTPSFEGRSQIRTFLFGILYNKARELRRHDQRVDSPDPVEAFVEERFDQHGHWSRPPVSPEKFTEALEITRHIQDCLEKLPTQQRMAFWLREVDDAPSEEICNALEVSATNLGVLMFRARNRLRECLESKL